MSGRYEGGWIEGTPLVEDYETWKQRTGVTDEDERVFLERRRSRMSAEQPVEPPIRTYHRLRRTARAKYRKLKRQYPEYRWHVRSLIPGPWGWKCERGIKLEPKPQDA